MTNKEQLVEAFVDEIPQFNTTNKRNLTAMLDAFNGNGRTAKRALWSIGNGGYDMYWQISYEGIPVIQDVGGNVEAILDGWEQWAKYVAEYYNETFVSNLEESVEPVAKRQYFVPAKSAADIHKLLWNENQISSNSYDLFDVEGGVLVTTWDNKVIALIEPIADLSKTKNADELQSDDAEAWTDAINKGRAEKGLEPITKQQWQDKLNRKEESVDNKQAILSQIFANYPDISVEDEDYLNSLSTDDLMKEIANRGWVLEEVKI